MQILKSKLVLKESSGTLIERIHMLQTFQHDMENSVKHFDEEKFERATNNGEITQAEFNKVYESRTGTRPSDEEFKKLLNSVDSDGNGTIGYNEFLRLMLHTPYKPIY